MYSVLVQTYICKTHFWSEQVYNSVGHSFEADSAKEEDDEDEVGVERGDLLQRGSIVIRGRKAKRKGTGLRRQLPDSP
jgi:hypothetical protein